MSGLNRALAYLTAVALLAPIGKMAWQAWGPLRAGVAPEGPAAASPAAEPVAGPAAGGSRADRIAAWHLFGQAPVASTTAPKPVLEAPKTRLQLTLRGVAAAGVMGDARAIIAEPSGRERHYRPGEAVPGGAKLAEVHVDRVILERNGRYETLPLVRQERGPAEPPALAGRLGPGALRPPRPSPPVGPESAPVPEPLVEPPVETMEAAPPQ